MSVSEADPVDPQVRRKSTESMPVSVSLYLDLVRFSAAFFIFIAHAKYGRFTDGWLDGIGRYGSDSVMIFFVLSGLVIAHVTHQRETDVRSYAIARLARLWSVALPALVLTLVVDRVGRQLFPPMYDGPWYQGDHAVVRLLVNAVFQGQNWFANLLPFTNTPYWSLGYEFWYYAIYAAICFLHGPARWLVLLLFALVCGPKVLLLLPVWMLGVGVYRLARGTTLPTGLAWVLWIGSFVGYWLYQWAGMPGYLAWRTVGWLGESFVDGQLLWSKDFVSNYVVGLLVAANFLGFWRICGAFDRPLLRLARPIRLVAGFTFSVYLFHMPLLHFYGALIHHNPTDAAGQVFIWLASAASIVLLGLVTEHKKSFARRCVSALFDRWWPRRR